MRAPRGNEKCRTGDDHPDLGFLHVSPQRILNLHSAAAREGWMSNWLGRVSRQVSFDRVYSVQVQALRAKR